MADSTMTIHFDYDFINKTFNIKEDKYMNGYKCRLACDKAIEKLKKLYDEKGCLTYEDVLNAMGVRVANAHRHRKQIVMSGSDGKGLNMETLADVIKNIDDHVYLPYKLPFGLEPCRMWQTDNGYTTVLWSDDTTTSVSMESDSVEHETPYGGFCACVVKKLYGSTGLAIKMMKIADMNAKWPARKKEIKRNKLKALKIKRAEMLRKKRLEEREAMIRHEMDLIYAKREANRRIAEENDHHEQ